MTDPYKVLGVSPNASDDEITQAYRKLAKQYHPDLHPGDKNAEHKMKELNAAYDEIKKIRQGGASYNPYGSAGNPYQGQPGYDPFRGFEEFFRQSQQQRSRQQQQTASSPQMRAAQSFVMNHQYTQALHALSEVSNRTAEWYYYSALANAGVNNTVMAINHAGEAVRLDPQNHAYRSLLQQLQQGGFAYRTAGASHGFSMEQAGRTLLQICLMQATCILCCRPC